MQNFILFLKKMESTVPVTRVRIWVGNTPTETTPLLNASAVLPKFEGRIIWIVMLAVFLFSGLFIGTYLLIEDGSDWEVVEVPYNYVSRSGWSASPPKQMTPLRGPVTHVMFMHTNSSECNIEDECIELVNKLQYNHMNELNLTDISYNFMVSNDAVIYEGRGWENQSPFPNASRTLTIAFIGKYFIDSPSYKQLKEAQLLIEECIQWKQLVPCYDIIIEKHNPLPTAVADWYKEQRSKICH